MSNAARIADFEAERPRLQRLAYRMLGSVSEAEDIVQDAWLRWARVDGGVDRPAAYLTRIVTHLCIDQLKSARVRRETYVGPWLPDPLIEPIAPDAAMAHDVALPLMLAMERLSPLERAAFLLHDIFDVALSDVAAMLGREIAAVRQLASRARQHVQAARRRYTIGTAEGERITHAFFAAARDGDVGALACLLAQDVEIHTDGGGKVIAFRNVVRGADRAQRMFAGFYRKRGAAMPTLLRTATINGLPGYISVERGVRQTTALDVADGRIVAIYIMRNPDKMIHIPPID